VKTKNKVKEKTKENNEKIKWIKTKSIAHNSNSLEFRPTVLCIFTILRVAITITLVLDSFDTSLLFRIKLDSLDFVNRTVLFQQPKEDSK